MVNFTLKVLEIRDINTGYFDFLMPVQRLETWRIDIENLDKRHPLRDVAFPPGANPQNLEHKTHTIIRFIRNCFHHYLERTAEGLYPTKVDTMRAVVNVWPNVITNIFDNFTVFALQMERFQNVNIMEMMEG